MARAIELAGIAIFINSRRFFLVASSELLSGRSVATAPGEIMVHRMFWECSSIRSPSVKAAGRALTEGLRMELHSQNIRCTMISPGAVATDLPESSSDEATRKNLREFMKMAIPANSIARAIAYAIEQPGDVEIDEIVVRPTAQDF